MRPVTSQHPPGQQQGQYPIQDQIPPQHSGYPQGYVQQGVAPQGYAQQGGAPQGYVQQGGAPQGYAQAYAYPQQHAYQAPAVQVVAPGPTMLPPGGAPPWGAPQRKRPVVLEILVVVIGGLLASAFLVLMALVTSGSAVVLAILASLVPLLIVGAVVVWVDRWEPEPRFLLIAAFLWGGGVSVAVASLLNSVVGPLVGDLLGSDLNADGASAVFGAPIVEEAMKGLGILLIFLVRRREFNGPVDGVVYASVVALGFAVVEDVQYFAFSSEQLGFVFVMRALLSPFGHVIFSVSMGLALGFASRHRIKAAWVWMFAIGYLVAVGLHMAWNGSLTYANSLGGLLAIFVFLNWLPLGLFAGLVIWLRRREAGILASRLRDYVPSGWLGEGEVQTLTSMRARMQARSWAQQLGPEAKRAMRTYQHAATALAYARQDLYTGHAGNRTRIDELANLETMAAARAEVMARSAAAPQYAGR